MSDKLYIVYYEKMICSRLGSITPGPKAMAVLCADSPFIALKTLKEEARNETEAPDRMILVEMTGYKQISPLELKLAQEANIRMLDETPQKTDVEVIDLVHAYQEYIQLLLEELKETTPVAAMHGWKSKRYADGNQKRKKIIELLQALGIDVANAEPLQSGTESTP